MTAESCGACGWTPSGRHPYGLITLCGKCHRIWASYCMVKLQGLDEVDVLPRWGMTGAPGQTYLCILCGYWHWTSSTAPVPEDVMSRVWGLCRYFEREGFHVNVARGWDRIRIPLSEDNR